MFGYGARTRSKSSATWPARALLDDAAWDAAYGEGQAMTLEQAIAYALDDTG